MSSLEEQLDAEMGKRSLYQFVKLAWPYVEKVPFVDNWHIEEMCKALEAVASGELKRLVINVPPGCMKSLTVGVFFQAWIWAREPGHRFMCASFDPTVTNRDASRLLQLIQSDWYKARWCVVPANAAFQPTSKAPVSQFYTTDGGMRFSTSVAGKATGFHANTQIVDDPIKPKDANDKAAMSDKSLLADCISWWKETMPLRAVNLADLRKVIIMQRLHEEDLVGYVLNNEPGWSHVCFPMRYDPDRHTKIVLKDGTIVEDRRTEEGELLYPGRFPEAAVAQEERNMGSRVTAAQFQQSPSAAEGNMVLRKWFQRYDVVPERFDAVIQSWDMSFKGSDGSDYVVGDLWGKIGADVYLLPGWIERRMGFSATLTAVKDFGERTPLHRQAYCKLVEDKANGPGIVDVLKKTISGLVLVNPDGGKEARLSAVTPFFEAGNVWHPSTRLDPRIDARENVLSTFPNVKNDDVVDATSQALLRLCVRSSSLAQAMQNVQFG